jgi:hypothetical protein
MMIMEQLVEWGLAGETEVLGENLPQYHFVHHKSHMIEPGPLRWESSQLLQVLQYAKLDNGACTLGVYCLYLCAWFTRFES